MAYSMPLTTRRRGALTVAKLVLATGYFDHPTC